ncbi:cytochrome c maturation protein CcmE [Desulfosporosinus metallidurans]|uniref:Cytochrome c-type biogenesis protein CcmE, heme chaperone n=1 Tax=Desulfosporosinus metallidurans TaxID=1888891 RepID=A0A1Q8QGQ7_9FIRM|nr:cytochrome c maturation protein CcmE [Desulfosporosinus metallidurans]OLN26530.1 Cytochrome c-type biogenesis protein CcmE, heme chaperone [Desulfosporosinus metallidurans]
MNKKLKFILVISIMLGAFGYLMISGFNNSKTYYMTINEVTASADKGKLGKQNLKVSGKLVGQSVKWDPSKTELKFEMISKDQNEIMPVLYKGVKPDNFNDGIDVIVDGKYTVEQVLLADKVMTKCPSKYEEQK